VFNTIQKCYQNYNVECIFP